MAKNLRMSLTFEPQVHEYLQQIDNASGYLSALVEDAQRAWRLALNDLTEDGWRVEEIRAAMDALNGAWMIGRPAFVAAELADAERLRGGITEKHGADPARWKGRCESAQKHGEALLLLAREFWSGNSHVSERLTLS